LVSIAALQLKNFCILLFELFIHPFDFLHRNLAGSGAIFGHILEANKLLPVFQSQDAWSRTLWVLGRTAARPAEFELRHAASGQEMCVLCCTMIGPNHLKLRQLLVELFDVVLKSVYCFAFPIELSSQGITLVLSHIHLPSTHLPLCK
jgi:hypothetical protein